VTLISQQATLLASNEAFKKQAESASEAAKKYMEENDQLKKVSPLSQPYRDAQGHIPQGPEWPPLDCVRLLMPEKLELDGDTKGKLSVGVGVCPLEGSLGDFGTLSWLRST
jgi:hypothetical protein